MRPPRIISGTALTSTHMKQSSFTTMPPKWRPTGLWQLQTHPHGPNYEAHPHEPHYKANPQSLFWLELGTK